MTFNILDDTVSSSVGTSRNGSQSMEDESATNTSFAYHPAFLIGTGLEIPCAALGLTANVCLLYALWKSRVVDANVRLLLGHISLIASILMVYAGLKSPYTLATIGFTGLPPSVHSPMLCWALELLIYIPPQLIIMSFVVLSLERLFVSLQVPTNLHKVYEDKVSLGIKVAVVTAWVPSVVFVVVTWLQMGNMNAAGLAAFCDIPSVLDPIILVFWTAFYFSMEILASGCYVGAWIISQTKLHQYMTNQALMGLRSRVLLSRCVDMTQMLIYSVVVQSVGYCVNIAWTFLRFNSRTHRRLSDVTQTLYAQNLLNVCLLTLHPLLCFLSSATLREHVCQLFGFGVRTRQDSFVEEQVLRENSLQEGEVRMQTLVETWNKAFCGKQQTSVFRRQKSYGGVSYSLNSSGSLSVKE